jgi:hypothetical protein
MDLHWQWGVVCVVVGLWAVWTLVRLVRGPSPARYTQGQVDAQRASAYQQGQQDGYWWYAAEAEAWRRIGRVGLPDAELQALTQQLYDEYQAAAAQAQAQAAQETSDRQARVVLNNHLSHERWGR